MTRDGAPNRAPTQPTPPSETSSSVPRLERVPPYDLEAEEALIGAMLLTRDAITTATAAGVDAADFYKPAHASIYQAIVRLHAGHTPIDPVTVASELNGALGAIGGRTGLLRLQVATPASANANAYARTVHELACRRRRLGLFLAGADATYADQDTAEIVEQLQDPDENRPSTWVPVDLGPILGGDLTPVQPSLFAREDQRCLLYAGLVHTFFGESESLKSWMALLAAAQELKRGRDVVFIDFEDTPESILDRLRALGVRAATLLDHLHYLRPDEPLRAGAIYRLEQLVAAANPTLVVIDGVTEAMAVEGLDLLDNAEVATWLVRLPRRIADLGPAVVLIDHVPKSSENRGRYAIGAQHKLAGVHVAYLVEPIRPLAHVSVDAVEPITGVSKITVAKDRPGAIRGFAAAQKHVGELHVTAYPDGGITGCIVPTAEVPDGGFRPTHLMQQISEFLAQHTNAPLTKTALRGAVKGKNDAKDLAIELLVHEGFVGVEEGSRRAQHHRLIRPFVDEPETTHEGSGDDL